MPLILKWDQYKNQELVNTGNFITAVTDQLKQIQSVMDTELNWGLFLDRQVLEADVPKHVGKTEIS